MNEPSLSCLTLHQLWKKLTSCTQLLITENEIVVAFRLAHFPGLFCLWFISFTFLTSFILFTL